MKISSLQALVGLALLVAVPLALDTSASAAAVGATVGPSGQSTVLPVGEGELGSLVQLRFSGALDERGHLVEVELDVATLHDLMILHVHLAPGTTGTELAQLVHERLSRFGAEVQIAEGPGAAAASVWVDQVRGVALRLGGGLEGSVATAEGAPSLIRVLASSAIHGPTNVAVTASAPLTRQGRPPLRRSVS